MREHKDNQEPSTSAASVPIRVTDRRPRFDSGSAADTPPQEPSERRYPSFVAELEARARTAEAKLAEALDLVRRREAEADEFRARLQREMEKRSRARVESFLGEFLEVLDSLDRGAAVAAGETDSGALRKGLTQVRDQLFSLLARRGVEPMSLVGTEYDPHLAEAVSVSSAEADEEDNRVLEETRRGFTLEGRVLRPAQVRVARRPAAASHDDTPDPPRSES